MRLEPAHTDALKRGKWEVLRAFGADRNCTAFAMGFRRRGGELTDEPVIVASVAKKRPRGYVARDRLLPRTVDVDGRKWGVDVIEAGPYTFGSTYEAWRTSASGARISAPDRVRPVRQGHGIWNTRTRDVGAFGCLVHDLSNGGALSILTAGNVLGSATGGRPGDPVAQPVHSTDPADVIARVSRFSELRKDRPNLIDAGVAQVTDESLVEEFVADEAMAPIGVSEPLIGIHISNGSDSSSLVQRADHVLREMNVRLYNDTGDPDFPVTCDTLDFDMFVEKTGPAFGYTSSVIVGMGATPINMGPPDSPNYYMFDDLVQIDSGFTVPGDWGSAVCLGGNGRPRHYQNGAGCVFLEGAGDMYDLPLAEEEELADRFRDDILLHTRVGRLLVRLFYVNYGDIVARLQDEAASSVKDYARYLYDTYYDLAKEVVTNPNTTEVVTQKHIDEVTYVVDYLPAGFPVTAQEYAAARALLVMFQRTLGMNRQQLLSELNSDSLYREVHQTLGTVPTIRHLGEPGADD